MTMKNVAFIVISVVRYVCWSQCPAGYNTVLYLKACQLARDPKYDREDFCFGLNFGYDIDVFYYMTRHINWHVMKFYHWLIIFTLYAFYRGKIVISLVTIVWLELKYLPNVARCDIVWWGMTIDRTFLLPATTMLQWNIHALHSAHLDKNNSHKLWNLTFISHFFTKS